MRKKRLFFAQDVRVLEKDDKIIVGNIRIDGRWIKLQKDIFEYITYLVLEDNVLEKIDTFDKEEQNYYKDVIQKLYDIHVLVEEEKQIVFTSLSIDVTTRCNLRCKHCCISCGEIPAVDLSKEDCIKLIKWSEKNGITHITFSGGEIFLHPHILEILKYARDNFQGKISIITNATLLNKELADFLATNIDDVSVSLDGYNEKSVDNIRGMGVFSIVEKNIYMLKESNVKHISATMVLIDENKKHIHDFECMCSRMGIEPALRTLNVLGRALENYKELQKIDNFNHTVVQENLTMKSVCYAGLNTLSIDAHGNVIPCVALNTQWTIGKIEELLNKKLKAFTKNLCLVEQHPICNKCNVRYFCSDSCAAINESIYNNETIRLDHCHKIKDYYEMVVWG